MVYPHYLLVKHLTINQTNNKVAAMYGYVEKLIRDEGSVVLFEVSESDTGRRLIVAADHRPAQDIVDALEQGDDIEIEFEAWAVVGSPS